MWIMKKVRREALFAEALCALCCGLIAAELVPGAGFDTLSYITPARIAVTSATAAGVFAAEVLFLRRGERALLFAMLSAYLTLCAGRAAGIEFAVGAACAIVLAAVLCLRGESELKFGARGLRLTYIAAGAVFVLFTGGLTALRCANYGAPNFDCGIFTQMFFRMRSCGLPLVSCERDGLLSHFAVHLSPALYLLLPLFVLLPSAAGLNIIQALVLAVGLVPLRRICCARGLSNAASAVLAICYCLYPAMSGGCFYDFHENCLLTPLLLGMFMFSEEDKPLGVWICAALVLSVKEDAAVYVAFSALYMFLSGRKKRGALLFAVACAYFALALFLLSRFGLGAMTGRYDNYNYDGTGLAAVIKTAVLNPGYVISQVFTADKLKFLAQMLLPLAALPLLTRRPHRLVLLGPLLLVNVMTNYVYQYSIGFQYTFGSAALLFYASALNLSELGRARTRTVVPLALALSLVFAASFSLPRVGTLRTYLASAEQRSTISAALKLVPNGASVAASIFFTAPLADREEVYELPTKRRAEWYVIDLRYADLAEEEHKLPDGCTAVYRAEGVIAVYRAP